MNIISPDNFLSAVKNTHLLLDTNALIDAFLHPHVFSKLFLDWKTSGVTLVTLELVAAEFLKGTIDKKKIQEKQTLLLNIIDAYLPVSKDVSDKMYQLIEKLGEDGNKTSMVDILLGTILMKYPNYVLLLTKNITDFPTNIFDLKTYFLLCHRKGIHVYGVYTYKNS